MNIGAKIILAFGVLGLAIAIASILAVGPIESHVKEIGEFHATALHSIQAIEGGVKGAVQESFAYVVSGDEVEKEEFHVWARAFAEKAETFEVVANLDRPGEEREVVLFDRIRDAQGTLVARAADMFAEYEASGSVSGETFAAYEEIVDALVRDLDALVRIERADVADSQGLALEALERSKWSLRIIGLAALLAAIGLGLVASRWAAQVVERSADATPDTASGEVGGPVDPEPDVPSAAVGDAVIVAAVAAAALVLGAMLDIGDVIFEFSGEHSGWEIDEAILIAVVLSLALGVFSVRRWREVGREIRRRRRTEQALREARGELEVRVRKRTEDLSIANESLRSQVAERKRAEGVATRFSRALEHSLNEIYFFDAETLYFVEVNRGARENLKYSMEELRSFTPLDLKPDITAEQFAEFVAPLRAGEREIIQFSTMHRRKDGTLYPVDVYLQLLSEDAPVFLAIILDTTERRHADEQRLIFERQIQHAQKLESLGVLAGGIAHDFNNLLTTILGNADLALHKLARMSPARPHLQDIKSASKNAADLAGQMLAYSGKGRFVIEPIDARELSEEIAHLLEVSISKKVALEYDFAENLPVFDGDVSQVRQVIMNLITNASEAIGDRSGVVALSTGAMDCDRAYLDEAHEVLRASLDEPLPEGLYVYIEVADTGCGMDAETIGKVFDPFFTTKFAGRGLGMSAVLGIVRGHRGALKVDSEVGKGTTFKVLFPASGLPENGATMCQADEAAGDDWRGTGTVLFADDEEAVCTAGEDMLQHLGFTVLVAPNGREALKVFREHADEIACVLLDLTMPEMDGEEAFREMRSLRPDVSVILCSGYNEQVATQRFAGKGLAGFLKKPFSLPELRQGLMQAMRSTGRITRR